MKNNTRKIVVLNNIDSPRIEQAIFILREGAQSNDETAAVAEAQRIVNEYVKKLYSPTLVKQRKTSCKPFLTSMLYVLSTAILAFFIFTIIK